MHIVYVCSPNRGDQLFISLRSLLTSGTSFRKVTIYCVGPVPASWRFSDPRFTVEEVPDIGDGFWMTNKIHLCRAEGDRVLFLDTDTIIMKPLDGFFVDEADVAGRVSTYALWRSWNEGGWERLLQTHGAQCFFPYLSTGVIVFRRAIPAGLADAWLDITRKLRATTLPELDPRIRANQLAFSLACGVEGLSHSLLSQAEHTYGWRDEPSDGVTIYHAGTRRFFRSARRLAAETRWPDQALPVPVPRTMWPSLKERVRYPLSRIWGQLEMTLKRRD